MRRRASARSRLERQRLRSTEMKLAALTTLAEQTETAAAEEAPAALQQRVAAAVLRSPQRGWWEDRDKGAKRERRGESTAVVMHTGNLHHLPPGGKKA